MWRRLLIAGLLGALVPGFVQAELRPGASASPDDSLASPAATRVVDPTLAVPRPAVGLPALAPTAGPAARHVALVIGNAAYAIDRLANPTRDARAVGRALQSLGFDVRVHEDLDRQGMERAIGDFEQRLAAGGTGLFYFAGHGFSVGGRTVLAPLDADRRAPATLVTRGVALDDVLARMSAPRPGKLNLVVLDTCLDDPFRAAEPRPADALPDATLVAYATEPDGLAADGHRLGRFTDALLDELTVPGRDATTLFARAAEKVTRATAGLQRPWLASSLAQPVPIGAPRPRAVEDALTVAPSPVAVDVPVLPADTESVTEPIPAVKAARAALRFAQTRGVLPRDSAEAYELTFWESIKDSEYIGDYEAYLKAYPNGKFAGLARARIERLRAAAKTEQPAKPAPAAPPPAAAPAERPRPAAPPAAAPERPRPAPVAPAPAPGKPAATAAAAKETKDCPACPPVIELPAGQFTMGSNAADPSERPAHAVKIAQPFAIGKYEVTFEQWEQCVAAGGCPKLGSGANTENNAPVRDVSWDDAQQYVKWLSQVSGKAYRLPTEAEWEYAARGGTSTRYWWGDQMRPGNANCKDCGEPWRESGPLAVGSFAANPYGLHDVNGGVWEWVADCWHTSYKGAPTDGSAWDERECRQRVIRGGSWRDGADYMLSSTRFMYGASVRHSQNGFRVARDGG